MTAPVETSWRVRSRAVSTVRTERFRALLLVVMEEQAAEFERQAEALATLTSGPARGTDRDRAIAALRMFSAREAIERIEDALVRIDGGSYAICQSCGRRNPFERLEAIPQAQSCAACGTDSGARRGMIFQRLREVFGHNDGHVRDGEKRIVTRLDDIGSRVLVGNSERSA